MQSVHTAIIEHIHNELQTQNWFILYEIDYDDLGSSRRTAEPFASGKGGDGYVPTSSPTAACFSQLTLTSHSQVEELDARRIIRTMTSTALAEAFGDGHLVWYQ